MNESFVSAVSLVQMTSHGLLCQYFRIAVGRMWEGTGKLSGHAVMCVCEVQVGGMDWEWDGAVSGGEVACCF